MMILENDSTDKSRSNDDEDPKNPIPTAAEEGFTPEEEKALLEKCDRLIEKFEEQMEEEDNSTDFPTPTYRLFPE
ncbi:hypothetical protein ACE1CD_07600 [Aerosakkonema sp. BLCC-F183]|uniref:hypothetical protein n=1 Tax=Aerosakkonema sp. BLCC-F183 TaxID=3342834 RepID=UPI0035B76AEC